MRRVLAILGLSIIAVLLIIVTGAGVFMATLDLNKYKGDLVEAAALAIGKKVVIEGDIHHSLFPLGLSVDKLIIEDDAKFGAGPFAEISNVAFKVNLKALVDQKLDIEEILVDELKVKLAIASNGSENWDFQPPVREDAEKVALKDEKAEDEESFVDRFIPSTYTLRKVDVKKTQVRYTDLRDTTDILLNLDPISLVDLNFGQDAPFKLSGFVLDRYDNIQLNFNLAGKINVTEDIKVSLNLPSAKLAVSNPAVTEKVLNVDLSTNLLYTNSMGSLNLNNLKASLAGTQYSGTLALILPGGANLAKGRDLDVRGDISFDTLDLDKLMPELEVLTPARELGKAPKGNNEAAVLLAGGAEAKKTPSPKSSGPSPLKGIVANLDLKAGALLMDKMKLQDFSAKVSLNENLPDKPAPVSTVHTDFDILKDVYGTVDFHAKNFSFDKINVDDIHVDLRLDDGVITAPYSAKAFAGSLSGQIQARMLAQPPSWHITNTATNLHAEVLTVALTGEKSLSGIINNSADLRGRTLGVDLKSLNGSIDFGLSKAEALNPMSETDRKKGGFARLIEINEATATLNITNGVATTDNILVKAPLGTAKGKGSIDLVAEKLDLDIDVRPGGVPPEIPIAVGGSFEKPSVMIDPVRLVGKTAKGIVETPIDIGGAIITAPIDLLKKIF